MKHWLRIASVALALLVAVPGALFVKVVFFPPTFDVPSIAQSPSYQDADLMRRAWALPVARTYGLRIDFQPNGSFCGPTSAANALRSMGLAPATPEDMVAGTDKCQTFGVCWGGLTLDDLAALIHERSGRPVRVIRDLTLANFRAELSRTNDPGARYIVNFQRGLLFGQGTGHHSPIGGYMVDEDLVLVLDVNENFKPWLVSSERLFAAMDSIDSSSGKKRGLLRVD